MIVKPWRELTYGQLRVKVFENALELGLAAAHLTSETISSLLAQQDYVRLVFSTGASQFTFVDGLKQQQITWSKVIGFHLDEYEGIAATHPASFRLWLKTRIEKPFKPAAFHYIEGDAPDPQAECSRYARLLEKNPIDLGFIGIGENGHIAFNDPPVANFDDPLRVKLVELDEMCRRQQVGEGWFPTVDDVPKRALTMTVPAIMECKQIFSIVPDARKANAVKQALEGPISTACPASILRTHPNATLFLDKDSASKLNL
ncbi:MAG: glucosamine-6-phosphate deaminase [Firmicutes bacterium]|jgi:glucosamine-6-phosphate deaminase|nr:glucosamine-6-phosphate deaminase [Bacillota bacterium]